jgi:hypothetical protein
VAQGKIGKFHAFVIATISNLKSDGGHIGSFYNLAGDGIRDAAERLVPVINRGRFAK